MRSSSSSVAPRRASRSTFRGTSRATWPSFASAPHRWGWCSTRSTPTHFKISRASAPYKFGSLTHTDPAVRRQAVEHNLECIEIGKKLGSKALTVWIGDGGNFPGQQHFARSFDRYLESTRQIYAGLPADFKMFLEHKLYEPALYSTVICDWGTSYIAATQLGPQCQCLVDLGHHAPNVNIEMIVARLIQLGKLGGFHFNDSKYGDDDLDTGSVNPFQIFLIWNELVDAAHRKAPGFEPAYMLDQSHNVTDPIESLMTSAASTPAGLRASAARRPRRAARLPGHERRAHGQRPLARRVSIRRGARPAMARRRSGGAIDPVGTYRASGYRRRKAEERPQESSSKSGIV